MSAGVRPPLRLLCVIAMPLAAAMAQKGNGRVQGMVVDHSSGVAVVHAEIVLGGAGTKVVTDSLGNYLIPDVPAGIVRLIVRANGFPFTVVFLALSRGETMSRVIEIDSTSSGRVSAQPLPGVEVTAPKPPTPRFVDFERRRLTGRGQYVVREEIERAGYSTIQDAMRGLRGVNIDCGSGSYCAIRMARAPLRCGPEYIVDERVDNMFGPTTAIRDIEGIEVYTGPSDVPGEFAGRNAGCGVIVIWTRAGPSRTKP